MVYNRPVKHRQWQRDSQMSNHLELRRNVSTVLVWPIETYGTTCPVNVSGPKERIVNLYYKRIWVTVCSLYAGNELVVPDPDMQNLLSG